MYRITDTHGTHQIAWTWTEALAWLACCSEYAHITNRFTGRLIASRYQPSF